MHVNQTLSPSETAVSATVATKRKCHLQLAIGMLCSEFRGCICTEAAFPTGCSPSVTEYHKDTRTGLFRRSTGFLWQQAKSGTPWQSWNGPLDLSCPVSFTWGKTCISDPPSASFPFSLTATCHVSSHPGVCFSGGLTSKLLTDTPSHLPFPRTTCKAQ